MTELQTPPELVISAAVGLRTPAEVVDIVRNHPALGWLNAQASAGSSIAAACSGTFFLARIRDSSPAL